MAENATAVNLAQGALDEFNTTFSDPGPRSVFGHLQDLDFLLLEFKLVGSAIAIIYLGAHAALRRPPSAAPSKKLKPGEKKADEERFSQGLEPSDAIVFPLMAATVLIGLYFLIDWLKDPNILNKILQWYMSITSIASLVSLYAHSIEVGTSLVFPKYWRGRDGKLRAVDQTSETVKVCDDVGNPAGSSGNSESPLPGAFAWLASTQRTRKAAWGLRSTLTGRMRIKFFMRGMGKTEGMIKFAHIMAVFLSIATALIYTTTGTPLLSNLLGYAMCYGSFLLLSPTDFLTSTLVLTSLFFYDIIMVFYTPYMIAVATKLDVPIKLTFEAAGRKSILGLGDIVVPGMVMALALRFDLWNYYERRIKYEETSLTLVEKDPASEAPIVTNPTKHLEIKPPYVDAKGRWGDRLWVRGTLFLSRPGQVPPEMEAVRFPKPYFYASMVGYLLGMLVTLAMLLIFKHGQPALLYLVPGVLGSLWLTGLARGEIKQMWKYTEDGSIDTLDVVVDLDGDGNAIKTVGKLENGIVDTTKKDEKDKKTDEDKKKSDDKTAEDAQKPRIKKTKKAGQYFMLSIDAPSEDENEDATVSAWTAFVDNLGPPVHSVD